MSSRTSSICCLAFAFALMGLSTERAYGGILTGLVAYYPFNSNANDASGYGNNLTLNGGATIVSGGVFGDGALSLANTPFVSNDYAAAGSLNAALDFGSGDFTIQTWVNFNSFAQQQVLLEQFTSGSGPGWTITEISPIDLQFYASPGGGGTAIDITPPGIGGFTVGAWYNVIVEGSGGTVTIYINGANVGSVGQGNIPASTVYPLEIGERNPGDGRDFGLNGLESDVAIWDAALTPGQIAYLQTNSVSASLTPEPSAFLLFAAGAALVWRARAVRAR